MFHRKKSPSYETRDLALISRKRVSALPWTLKLCIPLNYASPLSVSVCLSLSVSVFPPFLCLTSLSLSFSLSLSLFPFSLYPRPPQRNLKTTVIFMRLLKTLCINQRKCSYTDKHYRLTKRLPYRLWYYKCLGIRSTVSECALLKLKKKITILRI